MGGWKTSRAFRRLIKKHRNALMAILGDQHSYRLNKVAPMVNFLLERGVSVNSPPSEEYTSALHAAISRLNTQFIDRLLEAGADANAHDPRFGTALTAAAFWGDVDNMKKLLERGADLALAGEKYGLVTDKPPPRSFTSTDTFAGRLYRPQHTDAVLRLSSSFSNVEPTSTNAQERQDMRYTQRVARRTPGRPSSYSSITVPIRTREEGCTRLPCKPRQCMVI